MIYEYGVGAFGLDQLMVPDEDCLFVGKGPEQTILNFSDITAAFSSPDRRLEFRDIQLAGIGAGQGRIRATWGATASWTKPQLMVRNVVMEGWWELGECWLPMFETVRIGGREVGIQSIGRVMGLYGRALEIFPANDITAAGILIDDFGCEGADLEVNVVGALDGVIIDCPAPRPGWMIRGHTDTRRFGVRLVNAAQATVDILGYRRGSGAHNTVNAVGACDFLTVRGKYVNTGAEDGASAIVLGAGLVAPKVLDWHASDFATGLWIQAGVDGAQHDHGSALRCQTPVLDQGLQTVPGIVVVR